MSDEAAMTRALGGDRQALQEAYTVQRAFNAVARGIARDPDIKQRVVDGLCQIVGQGDLSGQPFKAALIEAMLKGLGK